MMEIPRNIKKQHVTWQVVRATITYSRESWSLADKHKTHLNITKMRFLKRIEHKTKKDRIKHDMYRQKLKLFRY